MEVNVESGSTPADRARSPNSYQYDHMGGLDVDDEDDIGLVVPNTSAMGRRGSLLLSDDTDEELSDSLVDDLKLPMSAWRRRSSATSPAINPPGINVPAPIVLAELPRLSELARVDRSGTPGDGDAKFELHSIAVSPRLDIVLLSGEGKLNLDVVRADGPDDSTESIETAVSLPSVYYLKRNGNRFYLDQSRSLRLPPCSLWFESVTAEISGSVYTAVSAVSDDSQFVAIGLSNGFVWLYSLEEVGWVCCISTYIANMWIKLMDDSSGECNGHSETLLKERTQTALDAGTVPATCLFLPSLTNDEDKLFTKPQINHMIAAAIGSSVLFWRIRDGCLLLDLSAHSSWVTAIRLLPLDVSDSDEDYVNINSLPIGLLTASSDGVIKRWEVGAACLPSPTTPTPMGIPSLGDAHLRRISQQSVFSNRSNDKSTAVHGLWTDVFDVWFGPHASLLVVGRRRHSSDLQVFSLHFDESHLYGIVKRFCLVTESAGANGLHKTSHSSVLDRVIHLHTWQSHDSKEEKSSDLTLVVLAVFASGTVRYWHMPSVSYEISGLSSNYTEMQPAESWPPMHDLDIMHQSRQQRATRKISTSELQAKVLCDNEEIGSMVPVTWSTLRSISKSVLLPPPSPYNYQPSSTPHSPAGDALSRTILVWLTAGFDGMIYGRQLIFPNPKLNSRPEDQMVSDTAARFSNPDSAPWRIDLAAHSPAPISDADIDPTGQWLLTGSTDETAKVWCLASGSLVFDTGTHGACVRSVCFRPVLDEPSTPAGHEWFVATGDDTGTLRIWLLTSKRLRRAKPKSLQYGQLNRSLSPDSLLYQKGSINRAHWHTSSSRHLNRLPSPDLKDLERPASRDARAAFFSNAAGFGGSWLRRLVWSPDGRLITGLSDRLCVWPFEAPLPHVASSGTGRDRFGGDLFQGPRLELKRCRVLRVLSSGLAERVTSSLHMLSVSPRRSVTKNSQPSIFPDLPPTIVTVDVNTGTLYVFDPIGALFQSELGD
ncbi:unnamed protein product [Echinostoma caproni]|uniref:WD_REPEATS_REGION domain-containing protein n=1 Tax=Echinostoma caproni TaxID=27848 RepID=A0A183AMJ4_9TREM|nr:unnamed protein product [Echinostoma caproni]